MEAKTRPTTITRSEQRVIDGYEDLLLQPGNTPGGR
jgi:hypothetical protein